MTDLEDIRSRIEKIEAVLVYGDGSGTKGLLSRIASVETSLETIKRNVSLIPTLCNEVKHLSHNSHQKRATTIAIATALIASFGSILAVIWERFA